jgi:hypothetical protein
MERRLEEFSARARSLRQRAQLDAAAVEAFAAFEGDRVQSLLLKGPALTRLLYAQDEHRGYIDIDFLVSPRHLERARLVLSRLGYKTRSTEWGIDDVAGILHAETWSRMGDDGPLSAVDLHWRLAGCEAPAQLAWDALETRQTFIDLNGTGIRVLNREGLALHLATHAAQGGPADVKATGDLTRGIERWGLDIWRPAARLAGELQAIPAFAAGLRLVPAGVELADKLDLPRTDRLTWEIMHRDARPRGTFHLGAWTQARGARERASILRRSLFPTSAWIAHEYPWAANSRARLVAAYGRHLLRTPRWALRAWRFRRQSRGMAP